MSQLIKVIFLLVLFISLKSNSEEGAAQSTSDSSNSNSSIFSFEPTTPDPQEHEKVIETGNETNGIIDRSKQYANGFCADSLCPNMKAAIIKIQNELSAEIKIYNESSRKCYSVQQKAKFICREETNPNLKSNIATINSILSVANSTSVVDKCSTIGKVMDIAQKGLTAYTTACSALQAGCAMSCKTAYSSLSKILTQKEKWMTEIDVAHFDDSTKIEELMAASSSNPAAVKMYQGELIRANKTRENIHISLNRLEKQTAIDFQKTNGTTTYRMEKCDKDYPALLASAGLGIFSTIKTAGQANNCKCDAGGCTPNAQAQLDCNGKDKSKQECICQLNPRLQGCPGADSASGKVAFGGGLNQNANLKSNLTDSNSNLDMSPDKPGAPESKGPETGELAGVGGGAGGGMGGEGVSPDGNGGSGGSGGSSLKPGSVLAGYGSGGGGGIGGGYGRADANAFAARNGLAKPGDRNIAGTDWTKEVTNSAGKSNWEKVKDRYKDNQFTLIGQ